MKSETKTLLLGTLLELLNTVMLVSGVIGLVWYLCKIGVLS
jgi:hypothetical protein